MNNWQIKSHNLNSDSMQSLVQFKDDAMDIVASEIQNEFGIDFRVFDVENIELVELGKAITRSFLRYNKNSILLAKEVSKKVRETFPDYPLEYCTLPYPIIHLPNDTSELGKAHTDGQDYVERFITTWTPLNNCVAPLAILSSHGIWEMPSIKLGETAMWYGSTKHEGLINLSDKTRVSLVIKFTSEPLLNERTISLTELDNLEIDYYKLFNSIDITTLTKKFISIYKEINKLPNDLSLFLNAISMKHEWDLRPSEARRLSFMLTLFSQRMEPYKDMSLFYLYSMVVAEDNFLGLQKIIDYSLKKGNVSITELFVEWYFKHRPSKQAAFSIYSLFNAADKLNMDDLTLLKWV